MYFFLFNFKLALKCLHYLRHSLLFCSVKGTDVAPASEAGQESSLEKKTIAGTVSLKAEAALSELDVLVRVSDKNLAEIKIRGAKHSGRAETFFLQLSADSSSLSKSGKKVNL